MLFYKTTSLFKILLAVDANVILFEKQEVQCRTIGENHDAL